MSTSNVGPGLAILRGYPPAWLRITCSPDVRCGHQIQTRLPIGACRVPRRSVCTRASSARGVRLFDSSRQLIVGRTRRPAHGGATLLPLASPDSANTSTTRSSSRCSSGAVLARRGGASRVMAIFCRGPFSRAFERIASASSSPARQLIGVRLESRAFLSQIWEFATRLGETHGLTLALGLGLLAVLIAAKRLSPKVPGPLVGVVLGGLLVFAFDLGAHGVSVVGEVPSGLPALRVPSIDPNDWQPLAMGAMAIALVSYCSAMLTARSFAARNHYDVDANQDFIALGAAIWRRPVTGFVISGADSTTAVNNAVGGKSRVTGLWPQPSPRRRAVSHRTAPLQFQARRSPPC